MPPRVLLKIMIHPSHRSEFRLLQIWVLVLLLGGLAVLALPAPDAAKGLAGYAPLHTALEVLIAEMNDVMLGHSVDLPPPVQA